MEKDYVIGADAVPYLKCEHIRKHAKFKRPPVEARFVLCDCGDGKPHGWIHLRMGLSENPIYSPIQGEARLEYLKANGWINEIEMHKVLNVIKKSFAYVHKDKKVLV